MKAKTKFSQPHAMHDDPTSALNLTEISSDLVQEANLYATATDDLPDLTTAEFGQQLAKMLSTETIKFFLEAGDYGRGFLSGLALGIFALEQEVDRQLSERFETTALITGDEDAELSEEDMKDAIYNGLKHGTKGGENDGENH